MIRLLFALFGKAIIRHIEASRLRPDGFDSMEFAYMMEGHDYYTWTDIAHMPPARAKHIERALAFGNAGIGENTMNSLCDMAEEHLIQGMKRGKDADKALLRVAHIVKELRNRPKEIIPEEVYYDLCATFVARKGEDPRTFDPAIHADKVRAITEAGRAGHDFFTVPPGWRKLLGSLLTTARAFEELSTAWTVQRIRDRAVSELHGRKP